VIIDIGSIVVVAKVVVSKTVVGTEFVEVNVEDPVVVVSVKDCEVSIDEVGANMIVVSIVVDD